MAYLFDVNTESAKRIFGESISSASSMIQIDCNIDNGCFDQSALTFYDPMGHAPEIFFQRRIPPNAETGNNWRHFTAKVSNADGRKPLFKISRQYRDANGIYNLSLWRGVYTQDFITWEQSNTPALVGGTTGTFEFSFPNPLPAGDVIIAHNLYGRQQEADAFATWLLVNNSSIAQPADPSYTGGNYGNSIAENNDVGLPSGNNPRYAIKLAFGGATTDGRRKRKLVSMYGIHAAGEGQAWWSFSESIKWLINSSSQQAQNLRANFDVWLYFNVNPNGIKSGWSRTTPRSVTDQNRNWSVLGSVSSAEEVDKLKRVIHSDVSGSCDAFFSWHGDVYATNRFMSWVYTDDYSSGTRNAATQALIDAGTSIWGGAPRLSTSGTDNTDVWFGRKVLGALISMDCENPSMDGSTTQYFAEIGENWMLSLESVDQQGLFFSGSSVALTGDNTRVVNRTTSGVITKTGQVILAGSDTRIVNSTTSGAVTKTSQITLAGSDTKIVNKTTGGQMNPPEPEPSSGGHFGGTLVVGRKKRKRRKDISSKRNEEIREAILLAINGEPEVVVAAPAQDLAQALLGDRTESNEIDINMVLSEIVRLREELENEKRARDEEDLLMRLL